MTRWLILPYDGSAVAQAALARAARHARRGHYGDGVLLAVPAADPAAPAAALARASAGSAGDLALTACAMSPADPAGALRRLLAKFPDATLVVPVGVRGVSYAYAEAVSAVADGGPAATLVLFIAPGDVGRAEDVPSAGVRSRLAALIGAIFRPPGRGVTVPHSQPARFPVTLAEPTTPRRGANNAVE